MDRRSFLAFGSQGMAAALFVPQLLSSPSGWAAPPFKPTLFERPLQNLAFGSCNQSTRDQRYWRTIQGDSPELWLWLGDNIYADGLSMQERRTLYRALKENGDYRRFREATPVLGTWDDHDYASDNQGGAFAEKWQSKEAFREFFDLSTEMLPIERAGVYQSYSFGPKGQKTQVILLDLRFHMQRAGLSKQLLGEEQWAWFEKEVLESDADLLIIASSLNVSSPVTGFGLEGWRDFGGEKSRLYELIDAARKPSIILSGDRHFAEISRTRLSNGLPVYEVMSSGLTHAAALKLPHPGRLGEMVGLKNYGQILIDWSDVGPRLSLRIKSTEGLGVLAEEIVDFAHSAV